MFTRGNTGARNHGLCSRDMARAGRNAMTEACESKTTSYSTAQQNADRFEKFARYCVDNFSINDSRKIENSHILQYAEELAERVEHGSLSVSSAHDYLSSVNAVIAQMRQDNLVRVTAAQTNIPYRSHITEQSKACSKDLHQHAKSLLDERLSILSEIQRELGLRFEESAKCNPADLLTQVGRNFNPVTRTSHVNIIDGTKGGRSRIVDITSKDQIETLKKAAQIQGSHRSMLPKNLSYKEFRGHCYSAYSKIKGYSPHKERHHYAQHKYTQVMRALSGQNNILAPVLCKHSRGREHIKYIASAIGSTYQQAKELDYRARYAVATSLGHARVDITNAYLG